jgi:hypothetical protein
VSALADLAAAVAAAVLAQPAPPPPRPVAPVATPALSAAAALEPWLRDAAGVVAFGEVHQDAAGTKTRSALARFTDDIFPALAPRAAHLVVETWGTTGRCGEAEREVTRDIARTTDRPAATESEIVRLLRRAKESGVEPHVLTVACDEYARLLGRGGAGVDYDALLTLTRRHLEAAIRAALRAPRGAGRPLVLVYGGALHNDLYPDGALRAYSFGPTLFQAQRGAYREVDLYVPELVERLAAMRAQPWFAVWRKRARKDGVTLIPRSAASAIVVFPRGVPAAGGGAQR